MPDVVFDFEYGCEGFEGFGDWEWGEPQGGGPDSAYSGQFCWGTRLSDHYSNGIECVLVSPSLLLFAPIIEISFWHWYCFESGRDGGWFEISLDDGETWEALEPLGGYPDTIEFNGKRSVPAYSGSSAGWEEATFNLSPFFGREVRIAFHMYSDSAVTDLGWFVDYVSLYGGNTRYPVGAGELESVGNEKLWIRATPCIGSAKAHMAYGVPPALSGARERIEIYDVSGALVAVVAGGSSETGVNTVEWDPAASDASAIGSGLYFVRLRVGNAEAYTKLLFLR